MKVYVELLFLDNLAMDFIIIFLSGLFAHIRMNYVRVLAAAALGGAYACFMFAVQGILSFVVMRVAVSLLMCFVAFYKKKQIKAYIKSVLFLYINTFIMGGAAFAFLNLSSSEYLIKGGIIIGSTVLRYILLGLATAILCILLFKRTYRIRYNKNLTYEITIEFMGQKMTCHAFLDTGNALMEPLSGLPVIIVEKDAIKKILPEEMNRVLDCCDFTVASNEIWFTKLRVLPCKGVFRSQEALFGFKPDNIYLKQENGERELLAVIAITKDVLNDTGTYQALLGPEVLA